MTLRSMTEADRPAFLRYHDSSRDHLRPWSPRPPEGWTPDRLFDEQIVRGQRGLHDGTALRLVGFAADGAPGAEILGTFNLNNIVRGVFQCADAGWQVAAAHTNNGIATEGVLALLDVAFGPPPRGLGLHRVQANVIPANAPSLRVAEKCGFRREGVALRMVQIDGVWQDHVMHAKLVDEHRASARS
jgi:ribosomal-protein-alanine N-acetyltransferase